MSDFWIQVGLKALRFIASAGVFTIAILLGKIAAEHKKKKESNV